MSNNADADPFEEARGQMEHQIASEIVSLEDAQERIRRCLNLCNSFSQIDGDHHKAWVLDQVVRVLAGEQRYHAYVSTHKNGEDGPNSYEWSVGVPP